MNLEFYFDLGSPTAYLAYRRLRQLSDEYPLTLVYEPMLLGGVFKAAGSASPITVPAKGRYMLEQDLPRFARRYGVALNMNPHFPLNTLALMRGVFAARALGCEAAYTDALFSNIWVECGNPGDPLELRQRLEAEGLDAEAIITKAAEPGIKQALISATEAAVERGVFGAPTMFVGDEMFFGQDRLDFIESLLRDSALRSPASSLS